MNLNYELCKKLKEVGFPQDKSEKSYCTQPDNETHTLMNVQNPQGRLNLLAAGYEIISCPNLSELIGECHKLADNDFHLEAMNDNWHAGSCHFSDDKLPNEKWKQYDGWTNGKTPEEAVMKLCLEMLKTKNGRKI